MRFRGGALLAAAIALAGCGKPVPSPIVGAWIVADAKAPFPMHMYVFNADGTMQQANPDAGDATASDSDGKGIWVADGAGFRGKWVEITADRATRKFSGRVEVSFEMRVDGNRVAGSETARIFHADGSLAAGPTPRAPLTGQRVVLP